MWLRTWLAYLLCLRRGDKLAILLVGAATGAAVAIALAYPLLFPGGFYNFGFASNWRCNWVGRGEPVCVEDLNRTAGPGEPMPQH
ncbi:MAG TPA: hypothetical protein VHW90_02380 [Stellaceae bacterium]|jgi:hypothetical protein|nr:hypothetical protein [Stellaceae bacterium]